MSMPADLSAKPVSLPLERKRDRATAGSAQRDGAFATVQRPADDPIVLATNNIEFLHRELLELKDLGSKAFFTSGLTLCKFIFIADDLTARNTGTWRSRCLLATAEHYKTQQNK